MISAHDVAAYICKKQGPITAMKLQKLVYYSQAWSLVWDEEPLFDERIEAWANGPVIPELFDKHRGIFKVNEWPHGDSAALNRTEKETIKGVLGFYGNRTSQWLSDLSHREQPWIIAREGLAPWERGHSEITIASMAEYYGSL